MSRETPLLGDVQARRPTAHVSLSRVGVTGVRKVIRFRSAEAEQLFSAELECFVDLNPTQKGAHMSRFEEIVEEAIEAAVLGGAFKAGKPASPIAEGGRARQGSRRAEGTTAGPHPGDQTPPRSGISTPRCEQ